LGHALSSLRAEYDRILVITDEQSHDRVPAPNGRGYVVNVASARNGVGYAPGRISMARVRQLSITFAALRVRQTRSELCAEVSFLRRIAKGSGACY
jgi:hypothetical protein